MMQYGRLMKPAEDDPSVSRCSHCRMSLIVWWHCVAWQPQCRSLWPEQLYSELWHLLLSGVC